MPGWLLLMVGFSILDFTVTVNGRKYNIASILRLAVFICCCIWG